MTTLHSFVCTRPLKALSLGLLSTLSLLAGGASMAQTSGLGFYALGGLGQSIQNSPANAGVSNLSGSGSATAIKLGGGMQITPLFGAELGYMPLGKVSIGTPSGAANYNLRITTLSATANWAVNDTARIVGRLGYGTANTSLSVPSVGFSGNATEHPLVLGLGLRYALSPKLDLTFDFDSFNKVIKFQSGGSANASAISFGGRYNF